MRPGVLWTLYRARLRVQWAQELFAAVGIAVGVTLAFAVLVANNSVATSSDEIVRGIVGTADMQLTSRDPNGFDEGILTDVERIPGVERAAPLLDQRAVLAGPSGRIAVNVASIDEDLAEMSGRLGGSFLLGGLRLVRGMLITRSAGERIGLKDPSSVGLTQRATIEIRGHRLTMPVGAQMSTESIGPLSAAPIAVIPLRTLQSLTGLPGRITRILVEAAPDQDAAVRVALERIAEANALTLSPALHETTLLKRALGPSNLTSGFFAALAAFLGFLLAFNAALLTMPDRRRSIAQLRINGYTSKSLAVMVISQALVLWAVASVVGLAAGSALAAGVFGASPHYLAPAFVPGELTVITTGPALITVAGGLVAALAATGPVLLDLRPRRAIDHVLQTSGAAGQDMGALGRRTLAFVALFAVALSTVLLSVAPGSGLPAGALLAVATIAATPVVFAGVLRVSGTLTRVFDGPTLTLALSALRATTLRSVALAATGAVAVFGAVAVSGARHDLLAGIGDYTADYVSTADLWIVNPNDNQATNPIAARELRDRAARVDGVADARAYFGSFLDIGDRRAWIVARPNNDRAMLPPSQVQSGDLAEATARLRSGGWVAVSEALAKERGARVGGTISLPTPTGTRKWRVAATTTNLGWAPGAIIMSATDYRRAWNTSAPTAIEVDLRPGSDPATVQAELQRMLGPTSSLRVQTANERADGIIASAEQGLGQLQQISFLLLAGAVLALASAMSAAIWQRRTSIASLGIDGYTPRRLWRVLLVESSIVLAAGCFTGIVLGSYGQVAADRYIATSTGFPVDVNPVSWHTVLMFVAVIGASLAIVAIPSWRASRVRPIVGLSQ